tara:strand:+ start:694 stop:822 length:129 start_codon:yes stop_codon:yes gene_type:complete
MVYNKMDKFIILIEERINIEIKYTEFEIIKEVDNICKILELK